MLRDVTCTWPAPTPPASPFLPRSSPRPAVPAERGRAGRTGAGTEPGCGAARDGHPQGAKALRVAAREGKSAAVSHQPGHKRNLAPTVGCEMSPRQPCTAEAAQRCRSQGLAMPRVPGRMLAGGRHQQPTGSLPGIFSTAMLLECICVYFTHLCFSQV